MMGTFLLLAFMPSPVKAADESKTVSVAAAKQVESTDAATQLARLEEINAMDKSMLSRSEKKELRSEVRAIKSDQDGRGRRYHNGRDGNGYNGRHGGGTVYIMGGSGLLIIILIIVLL